MDREEFYRLKKVKGMKEKDKAAEEAEHTKRRRDSDKENEEDDTAPKDMLGDEEDQDVIF